ncbi:carbohydrate ABC transporter permease [Actinomadura madurae]
MIASLYLSFTDYSLLSEAHWVGLDNYDEMFTADDRYMNSLTVTTTYVVVSVPLQLAFALGLAIALDKGLRGLSFYRSVFYLPSLLGGSVAISILWRKIFGVDGIVNTFLGWFGYEGQGWVTSPDTALWTLIILHVWTFGAPMVIFLAGLRQIPRTLYEAARVDGAGRIRQFRSITLPLLTPIIFFNAVLEVIKSFQSFTQAFVVSGGNGGPVDSTLFYTLYLYIKGFKNYEMGYAAAMAWVLLLIIGALTAVNFLMSRFWVFYGDDK